MQSAGDTILALMVAPGRLSSSRETLGLDVDRSLSVDARRVLWSMVRVVVASLLAAAACLDLSAAWGASSRMTCKDWHIDQDWKVGQIDIAYIEPTDPAYSAMYYNLKKRQLF